MDARVKPAHDEGLCLVRPRLCSAPRRRRGGALRCVRGTEAILQNAGDAAISADFIARTGEICMTIVISQIAPSRPMLMLDACVAR
jgi:hypothetical protein